MRAFFAAAVTHLALSLACAPVEPHSDDGGAVLDEAVEIESVSPTTVRVDGSGTVSVALHIGADFQATELLTLTADIPSADFCELDDVDPLCNERRHREVVLQALPEVRDDHPVDQVIDVSMPASFVGPFSITLRAGQLPIASAVDVGTYVALPPEAVVGHVRTAGPRALTPEIARASCGDDHEGVTSTSMLTFVDVENHGDTGLVVTSVEIAAGSDAGFEVVACSLQNSFEGVRVPCVGTEVSPPAVLQVSTCFSSSVSGTAHATLKIGTNGGELSAPLSGVVRAQGQALDATFAGTGARTVGVGGVLAVIGDGVMAGGTIVDGAGAGDVLVVVGSATMARAHPSADEVFVLNASNGSCALSAVRGNGRLRTTFGLLGKLGVSDNGCPHHALAVADDVVFAAGNDVHAFTVADGSEVDGFRSQSVQARWLAADRAFVYVGTGGVTTRYDHTGLHDAAFLVPHSGPMALSPVDGALYIADSNSSVLIKCVGDAVVDDVSLTGRVTIADDSDLSVDALGRVVIAARPSPIRVSADLGTFESVGLSELEATTVSCPRTGTGVCYLGYDSVLARIAP